MDEGGDAGRCGRGLYETETSPCTAPIAGAYGPSNGPLVSVFSLSAVPAPLQTVHVTLALDQLEYLRLRRPTGTSRSPPSCGR